MPPIKQQLIDAIDQAPESLLEQLLLLLQTLLRQSSPQPTTRAPFGSLRNSGQILGDIVSPIVPLGDWDALQ
jgi:hypothetical protein